ncbi:DUF6377 domain-containing protein [Dysgonomonas sp. BGC7]|uniref:DUF6377 domain-containing protein n=1 Tax=Dysgonomonas sp. BGC7 TaxID=1658008 RepID=UPI0006828382|nr:DUF6377 domain-containing protein [Dysgonomonas sp. BGC7]MBD8388074.1 hypothetical protein [Dysgonomonas sp. BGC7]
MKLLLKVLLIFMSVNIYSNNTDSLLRVLDQEIGQRHVYMCIKNEKIDHLRKQFRIDTLLANRYKIYNDIFEEYCTYKYDSAIHYLLKSQEVAAKLKNVEFENEVKINFSKLLSTAGLINEALNNMQLIKRNELDSSLLLLYNEAMENIYYIAQSYSNDNIYAPQYRKEERAYIDSICNMLPKGSIIHSYYEGYRLFKEGDLERAKMSLLELYRSLEPDTRIYAIVNSNLATISRLEKNFEDYEKYLILAAISDQRCALKENTAMQRLAVFLFKHKPEELVRAYQYINYAMEDALFYNNRLRMIQIGQDMPVIIKAYQKKNEDSSQNLQKALIAISILLAIVIILLIYAYKQFQIVKKDKKELSDLNEELNRLNNALLNANRIRGEAIILFVDLSSSYINKMDLFRETVKRKILAKQIDELYEISNVSEPGQSMQVSFIQIFDNAFLRLYPSFVDEFNELLVDEGKIKLKEGELLNTELRIFALIKLGIRDSSKISSFLRYSPQTIYNYRNKVKNFSIVDRNSFESCVQEIGEIN